MLYHTILYSHRTFILIDAKFELYYIISYSTRSYSIIVAMIFYPIPDGGPRALTDSRRRYYIYIYIYIHILYGLLYIICPTLLCVYMYNHTHTGGLGGISLYGNILLNKTIEIHTTAFKTNTHILKNVIQQTIEHCQQMQPNKYYKTTNNKKKKQTKHAN